MITANVRGRDLGSFVTEARTAILERVELPEGYWIEFGGTFEQLESATARLQVLVPVALLMMLKRTRPLVLVAGNRATAHETSESLR